MMSFSSEKFPKEAGAAASLPDECPVRAALMSRSIVGIAVFQMSWNNDSVRRSYEQRNAE
jgi:hypothetical protein